VTCISSKSKLFFAGSFVADFNMLALHTHNIISSSVTSVFRYYGHDRGFLKYDVIVIFENIPDLTVGLL
jgi:hypothetical protein